jgi:predicted PurR-regulated permease PerM
MGSLTRWFALAALLALLWVARDILPPFIVAGILAYILSPVVDQLAARFRWRRPVAALLVFACLAVLLVGGLWLLGARLVEEVRLLGRESPDILGTIAERVTGGQRFDILGQELSARVLAARLNAVVDQSLGEPSQAMTAARLAVDVGLNVLLCLIALAYLLVDGGRLEPFLLRFVPPTYRAHVAHVSTDVRIVLGRYLRGQLILVVLMSTVTFIVLEWIFHLPYALWLGIMTGILELIPLLGPFTAGTIACAVALSQGGPTEAIGVGLTYFALREVEDQLVMPVVVGRAVHVHPLLTIFAVLTGERIAGVLGMILAVPIAAGIKVVLDYAYPALSSREAAALGVAADEEPSAVLPAKGPAPPLAESEGITSSS